MVVILPMTPKLCGNNWHLIDIDFSAAKNEKTHVPEQKIVPFYVGEI